MEIWSLYNTVLIFGSYISPRSTQFLLLNSKFSMKGVYWILFFLFICCQNVKQSIVADDNPDSRPNIVFILSDDQRHDVLGSAGHPIIQTPHLDALAKQGTRFTHAFVTTPICAASRATILTGLVERTHGYTFGMEALSTDEMGMSYPKILRDHGYRTGFFGKIGVKMDVAPDLLFDEFSFRDRPYLTDKGHIDALNTSDALAFIENNSRNQPFCLSVSYSSAHAEDGDHLPGEEHHFAVIEPMKGKYAGVDMPLPRLGDNAVFEKHPDFLRQSLNRVRYHWRWDTPEKYQENMRAYYGLISGLDYMVGEIIQKLEEENLSDNTIIIYMGDNGYYMGERGFAGKWSHYDESIRVPLIIYDPRHRSESANHTIDELVLNLDIAPTILDLAAISIPTNYQGQSLLPFVKGRPVAEWRQSFFMEHLMVHPQIPRWEGVRTKDHVYARYLDQDPIYEYLHDLKTDPLQLENNANKESSKLKLEELRRMTDEYLGKFSF